MLTLLLVPNIFIFQNELMAESQEERSSKLCQERSSISGEEKESIRKFPERKWTHNKTLFNK